MIVIGTNQKSEDKSKSAEDLLAEMRLYEQMISCIDFVLEKTSALDSDDPILSDLQTILETYDRRHENIVSAITANKNKKNGN